VRTWPRWAPFDEAA